MKSDMRNIMESVSLDEETGLTNEELKFLKYVLSKYTPKSEHETNFRNRVLNKLSGIE